MPSSESLRRVAIFVRYLEPGGGIEEKTVLLANNLADRGYQVDLVLAKGEGALAKNLSPRIRVLDFSKSRVWKCLGALSRYISECAPDAILSLQDRNSLVAICAKLLSGKEVRLVVVNATNTSESLNSQGRLYRFGVEVLMRLLYPHADVVAGVSKGVLHHLRGFVRLSKPETEVLYNPVVSDQLFEASREEPEHPWFHSEEKRVVLGVGRLVPQKNFPLLIHAFADAYEENGDLRLVILGEGSQKPELESIIEKRGLNEVVLLPGYAENPYSYMARADLFVLSSNYEGFGIVIAEALACGCPVVSTDCPYGPREILENGEWGSLVPVGDKEALAEAMMESLSEAHDPERLRRRAMDFHVDKAVDEYLRVLFPKK